jgi:hypothetical protein
MIPLVLNCIATDLALHGDTFRMDSSHETNHDDAWLGLPADEMSVTSVMT